MKTFEVSNLNNGVPFDITEGVPKRENYILLLAEARTGENIILRYADFNSLLLDVHHHSLAVTQAETVLFVCLKSNSCDIVFGTFYVSISYDTVSIARTSTPAHLEFAFRGCAAIATDELTRVLDHKLTDLHFYSQTKPLSQWVHSHTFFLKPLDACLESCTLPVRETLTTHLETAYYNKEIRELLLSQPSSNVFPSN